MIFAILVASAIVIFLLGLIIGMNQLKNPRDDYAVLNEETQRKLDLFTREKLELYSYLGIEYDIKEPKHFKKV